MCDFQVRFDVTETPSSVREVEASGPLPFMRPGGKSGLYLCEIKTCDCTLWLNRAMLSLPYFSVIFKSLARREAEMFLWNGISQHVWSCKKDKL